MIITLATMNQKPEMKVELTTADIGTLWKYGLVLYKTNVLGKGGFQYAVYVEKSQDVSVDICFQSMAADDEYGISLFISLDAIVELLKTGSQRYIIAQSELTVMLCIKGA